jgi:hypothetical protein
MNILSSTYYFTNTVKSTLSYLLFYFTLRCPVGLGLYENKFSGKMPFLQSAELISVFLQNNTFTGSIDFLSLERSELTGKISLTEFDVKGNLFSGDIPIDLGTAEQLIFASFLDNDLTGAMPNAICDNRNNASPPGNLEFLEADCADPIQEFVCPEGCCTFCN